MSSSHRSSVTMSRSRAKPDDIGLLADQMLQSSLSDHSRVSVSQATTLASPSAASSRHRSSKSSKGTSGSLSSLTRERLRRLEAENGMLRDAFDKEKDVVERIKREGHIASLSTAEAKLRVSEMKRGIKAAAGKASSRSSSGTFKAACSTDLLFLIDTTGSMACHIDAAKNQVRDIVSNIETAFFGEATVRMAVVGYKDHSDHPNIEFLDFTPSTNRVRSFIDSLTAIGGDDEPEDVLGAIKQAINASWQQQNRCIIHIGDAPPHGHVLQNTPPCADDYAEPGSEPHGLTHEHLLAQMIKTKINYGLLRINGSTDTMAYIFFQAYRAAAAKCKLHTANRHYYASQNLSGSSSYGSYSGVNVKSEAKAELLFEEFEFGTNYDALRHLVVKVVTSSAARTAVRITSSRTEKHSRDLFGSRLAMIAEDGAIRGEESLENVPPRWSQHRWFDETLTVEGFSPDVPVHESSTLDDMMKDEDNIQMSVTQLTIRKRSKPFAQGAMRTVFYARTAASKNNFVVKSYKKGGKTLAHLAEDMRCQAMCRAFAVEFTALSGMQLDFVVTTCLKGKSKAGGEAECLSLEPFIDGTYIKYNSNCGYVNEDGAHNPVNQAAQAFSHFTFERSKGQFMVTDVQGIGTVLTDPAIQTKDRARFALSDTNLNEDGFKFFFASHKCNHICRQLELKSTGSMFTSGPFQFRSSWPRIDNNVCCSNKLCGKIVQLSSAKSSDNFPGHQWCDSCWPQLESSMVKWVCTAPGPHHEFELSTFYFESQGRHTPRTCPEHRTDSGSRSEHPGVAKSDGPRTLRRSRTSAPDDKRSATNLLRASYGSSETRRRSEPSSLVSLSERRDSVSELSAPRISSLMRERRDAIPEAPSDLDADTLPTPPPSGSRPTRVDSFEIPAAPASDVIKDGTDGAKRKLTKRRSSTMSLWAALKSARSKKTGK